MGFSKRECFSASLPDKRGDTVDISYVKGIHNIKAGIQYEQTFVTENDHLGMVDPTLNPVCLNADGSPDTSPR